MVQLQPYVNYEHQSSAKQKTKQKNPDKQESIT